MGKWVTDYAKGGYIATGKTWIDDDGEQVHYDVSGFLATGRSEPNAYGGLDHTNVSGTSCHGHTERYGDDDVHTDVSGVFVEGRTEHYDDRSVHTDVSGVFATGFSRPGGSVGLHGPSSSHSERSGTSRSGGRDIHSDYDTIEGDSSGAGMREGGAGRSSRAYSRPYYSNWTESKLFLPRISFPLPKFSDDQILAGIAAAVSVLIVGTILSISYWPEIRRYFSSFRNPPVAAVSTEPPAESNPERTSEERLAAAFSVQMDEPAMDAIREAPRQAAPPPTPPPASQDGHRGPNIDPNIGQRPSAQSTPARTATDAESSGRRRHPADYDVVGFECSKVNNNRLRCDAQLRDGRWKAVTCNRVGTGRILSCGPFGPGHDRQEFDVRWVLRGHPRQQYAPPPPRPPRYVRRY